jgi:AraC family transcriptional regulator, transcriptional activator of pobA
MVASHKPKRSPIPIRHYDLYGERDTRWPSAATPQDWTNSYHFERIPVRSGRFNWEIEPHQHDAFLQLLLLTSGGAEVVVNGRSTRVAAPALVLIPAQNVHGFHFTSDTDGPVVTAAQKPLAALLAVLAPGLEALFARPVVLALAPGDPALPPLAGLFAALEQEWRVHQAGHAIAGLAVLAALLVHVARLSRSQPDPGGMQPSRQGALVDRFKTLVNEKFRTHLPVEAYASRLGVSAGQLTRLTRHILGTTAQGVLNARLLFEAERDLIYTVDSVKQIAASLGFDDAAYFSRFFRKHRGQTPLAFRAAALHKLRAEGALTPL